MTASSRWLCGLALYLVLALPALAQPCGPFGETAAATATAEISTSKSKIANPSDAVQPLGVSRVVEIDASNGPLFGDMSKLHREDSFLGPKEIVLTFDDGPLPWITKSILDTLDRFCTKATFFAVGKMALAYPDSVKDVLERGHTLGSHTWSHPLNIGRLSFEKGKDEIERGFAAVALAAGQPIAPFFRFPGLNDSDPLLNHLQSRGIATFTVDVISNDSFIGSPERLTVRLLDQTERRNGGILLFHDIKASTAKALPGILKELQARGYKVVHMRAKGPVVPVAALEAELAPVLTKSIADVEPDTQRSGVAVHQLRPFYGSATLLQAPADAHDDGAPVTELAPEARTREAAITLAPQTRALRRQKRPQTAPKAPNETGAHATAEAEPKQAKLKWRPRPVKKVVQPVNGTQYFLF